VELWLDFSGLAPGTERVLRSLPFEAGGMGMMGMGGGGRGRGMRGRGMGMMGMMGGALPNGSAFDVLRVRVERDGETARPLPARLSEIAWPRLEDAINRESPRTIQLQMGRMQVALNGRTFEMEAAAPDERVKLGTTEVWEFANTAGPMSHPMHLHNLQYRVIDRRGEPRLESMYATVRDGLVDEGWKDTVIVMPGERVRALMRFEDYTGLYLYHCHILEHEDMGMMRNYLVEA
jgi:FtsP/CotA-like multicopper oxidase with cupredoxin domain